PYQTYESVDQASARSIVPLLVDLRQATDGGRAFSDRPLAQPQPPRPLLTEPAGNLPIDPMTALGILAVLEALVAHVRRGRIGLSGHALALTGLAGLGYLVALPYWAAGIARLAVDAESFITNPNLPIERLSLSFVTAPGYWLFLLASLALACAGLLLNALKQAGAPAQPPTAGI
ncbi:MAG TPA: hypothetical protein VHL09_00205, partial [Dehalococcoidia bacterium]|nr:hypothetical protein [Dehalococcoidia bacterium]